MKGTMKGQGGDAMHAVHACGERTCRPLRCPAAATPRLAAPPAALCRAYRGVWHGTDVCVKILNLHAPLSPGGGGGASEFAAAPLLEAALSKALLHPNIVRPAGLGGLPVALWVCRLRGTAGADGSRLIRCPRLLTRHACCLPAWPRSASPRLPCRRFPPMRGA